MLKKVLTVCILSSLFLAGMAMAQEKQYFYYNTLDTITAPHGIAVDPDGKIWYASYSDSVGIIVTNPDGTPASFSPIQSLNIESVDHAVLTGCRGMNVDPAGNIVVVMNGSKMYRINYQDGSGMNFGSFRKALTKPAIDQNGNIYVGYVAGAEDPILLVDTNLDSVDMIAEQMVVWSRAMEITPDGHDLYVGSLWHMVVPHWHSDDGLIYELTDSLPGPTMGYFDGHTTGLNIDREGKLWVSDEGSDSYYIYDLNDLSSQKLEGPWYAPMADPRGAAFSPDTNLAYVVNFGSGLVQIFSKETPYDSTLVFDDFEDGDTLNAVWGGGWEIFSDGSPASNIAYEIVPDGFGGSNNCLHITGKYASYGGAVANFNPEASGQRMGQFQGITFAAQGTSVPMMVRIREKKAESDRGWNYYRFIFTPTEEWKEYVVYFDSLTASWDPGPGDPAFTPFDLYAMDFEPAAGDLVADAYIDDIKFWRGTPPVATALETIADNPLPEKVNLKQNYPNPFNPSTTLEFEVVAAGDVSLRVFNLLGQEVAVVVNDRVPPGNYRVQFAATSNMASGVYLYQLRTGNSVVTKKMILMK